MASVLPEHGLPTSLIWTADNSRPGQTNGVKGTNERSRRDCLSSGLSGSGRSPSFHTACFWRLPDHGTGKRFPSGWVRNVSCSPSSIRIRNLCFSFSWQDVFFVLIACRFCGSGWADCKRAAVLGRPRLQWFSSFVCLWHTSPLPFLRVAFAERGFGFINEWLISPVSFWQLSLWKPRNRLYTLPFRVILNAAQPNTIQHLLTALLSCEAGLE